jgi:hypothetical protein
MQPGAYSYLADVINQHVDRYARRKEDDIKREEMLQDEARHEQATIRAEGRSNTQEGVRHGRDRGEKVTDDATTREHVLTDRGLNWQEEQDRIRAEHDRGDAVYERDRKNKLKDEIDRIGLAMKTDLNHAGLLDPKDFDDNAKVQAAYATYVKYNNPEYKERTELRIMLLGLKAKGLIPDTVDIQALDTDELKKAVSAAASGQGKEAQDIKSRQQGAADSAVDEIQRLRSTIASPQLSPQEDAANAQKAMEENKFTKPLNKLNTEQRKAFNKSKREFDNTTLSNKSYFANQALPHAEATLDRLHQERVYETAKPGGPVPHAPPALAADEAGNFINFLKSPPSKAGRPAPATFASTMPGVVSGALAGLAGGGPAPDTSVFASPGGAIQPDPDPAPVASVIPAPAPPYDNYLQSSQKLQPTPGDQVQNESGQLLSHGDMQRNRNTYDFQQFFKNNFAPGEAGKPIPNGSFLGVPSYDYTPTSQILGWIKSYNPNDMSPGKIKLINKYLNSAKSRGEPIDPYIVGLLNQKPAQTPAALSSVPSG